MKIYTGHNVKINH